MKNILKQLLSLLFFFTIVYVILFVFLVGFIPTEKNIDTGRNSKLYAGSARQVVMNRESLKTSIPKIILIGSSNVREGFRPEELAPDFPTYDIHNLGAGASNLTQIKKMIELVYEVMPVDAQKKSIFVLGFWYGHLVDDQIRWKDGVTDVENEQMRFGLYHKDGTKIVPGVPQKYFSYYVKFLYPFLVFDNAMTQGSIKLKDFFEQKSRLALKGTTITNPNPGDSNLDEVIVDENARKHALSFWHDYMGTENDTISLKQFEVLLDIVRLIGDHGSKLLIVDLPIPSWHSNQSHHLKEYEATKGDVFKRAQAFSYVSYINLQDLNTDEDFYDSAHPKPRVTKKWSERLAQGLTKIINRSK